MKKVQRAFLRVQTVYSRLSLQQNRIQYAIEICEKNGRESMEISISTLSHSFFHKLLSHTVHDFAGTIANRRSILAKRSLYFFHTILYLHTKTASVYRFLFSIYECTRKILPFSLTFLSLTNSERMNISKSIDCLQTNALTKVHTVWYVKSRKKNENERKKWETEKFSTLSLFFILLPQFHVPYRMHFRKNIRLQTVCASEMFTLSRRE